MEFNLNNNIQLTKKQKKKKMVRSSITTTTSCLSNGDLLISEILTKLRVKTLIRFKSVCKEWCSLIEKDQNFIHSHLLTHSKTRPTCRIFIVVPVPLPEEEIKKIKTSFIFVPVILPNDEFYITADLFSQDNATPPMKAVVDTVREVDSTSYDMITIPPVNGLFCLIESQLEHVVRICNISTLQVSPSFPSTLSKEFKRHNFVSFQYGFGFDPATNKHKLVCVWHVRQRIRDPLLLICEVLTLGQQGGINSWRRINDVPPPDELSDDFVCVNGVIYWSTLILQTGFRKFGPASIVAFDVGMEKFRTIIVPDLILGETAYQLGDDSRHDRHVSLLEVSGCLALLITVNHSVFKMYIYENDDYKKEEEDINRASTSTSFSSSNNERWIEVRSITLPLDLKEHCVKFHTFVGSDDKIIVTFSREDCRKIAGTKKCSAFYCFNWKKDSWTEFEVSGIPSQVPHICFNSSFTTFSESLLPVNS